MDNTKILIIQTASIGDVILSTAMAESVHLAYPSTQIHFLVKKGMESLFRGHPFIHKIYTWDKRSNKYLNLLKLIIKVRREKYQVVVNAHRFFSSGLITALSAGALTIGFRKNPCARLFSHAVAHCIGDGTHETERNFLLLQPLKAVSYARPRLYPTELDQARVRPYAIRPLVTISPASLWFTKQYPEDAWIRFIRHIPSKYDIILNGGPEDHALCERIRLGNANPLVKNLAGQLSLLESAALMKLSVMNYVNDSAPMHLASAVNAPVKAVFCSTVPAFGFGPLSDMASVVQTEKNLPCRPCGLHGHKACPEGHFDCANSIDIKNLLLGL